MYILLAFGHFRTWQSGTIQTPRELISFRREFIFAAEVIFADTDVYIGNVSAFPMYNCEREYRVNYSDVSALINITVLSGESIISNTYESIEHLNSATGRPPNCYILYATKKS